MRASQLHTVLFSTTLLCPELGAAETVKLIHESANYILVELNAEEFQTSVVTVGREKFTSVMIPGFTLHAEGGDAVPVSARFIAVPEGTDPKVTVVAKVTKKISLAAPLIAYQNPRRHCQQDAASAPVPALGKTTPLKLVSLSPASYVGPLRAALLNFSPLLVRGKGGDIEIATKVIAKITFEKSARRSSAPINAKHINQATYDFYRSFILNRAAFTAAPQAGSKDHALILSLAKFGEALRPFIKFKEATGTAVTVKYVDDSDAAQISAFIKAQYRGPTPPTYTVIVGAAAAIPAFATRGMLSDHPYTLLDRGAFPDISLSRIAAANADEVLAVTAKIIARETQRGTDLNFLLTSGFESEWCHANLQHLADEILTNAQMETKVSKVYASDGMRTDAVIAAYNANPSVIIYDGLGDASGMSEIPLNRAHLKQLRNKVFPILVDLSCDHAQQTPSAGPAFAEAILATDKAGAAGVVAFSGQPRGHELITHFFRAAVFDEREDKQPYHQINTLGTMLLFAKIKYLEEAAAHDDALTDITMLHYYGDAGSTFSHIEEEL